MIASAPMEDEIRAALASRLEEAKGRKEKTRIAASFLFFEHGIYPSAKTVLSYTGQGSMTDISADLREFWGELRERFRVKLDAPYLPESLVERFSASLAGVWEVATQEAQNALEGERAKAAELVFQAQASAEQASKRASDADERARQANEEIRQERERRESAELTCGAQATEISALLVSVRQWQEQAHAEAQARKEAEERFSRDLQDERAARARDAEIFNGEIRFAKRQIDVARVAEQEARERFKLDLAGRDVELAAYRQRVSKAEERVAELTQALAEAKLSTLLAQKQKELESATQENRKTRMPMRRRISAPVKKKRL